MFVSCTQKLFFFCQKLVPEKLAKCCKIQKKLLKSKNVTKVEIVEKFEKCCKSRKFFQMLKIVDKGKILPKKKKTIAKVERYSKIRK